jgi:hypothetical protein
MRLQLIAFFQEIFPFSYMKWGCWRWIFFIAILEYKISRSFSKSVTKPTHYRKFPFHRKGTHAQGWYRAA